MAETTGFGSNRRTRMTSVMHAGGETEENPRNRRKKKGRRRHPSWARSAPPAKQASCAALYKRASGQGKNQAANQTARPTTGRTLYQGGPTGQAPTQLTSAKSTRRHRRNKPERGPGATTHLRNLQRKTQLRRHDLTHGQEPRGTYLVASLGHNQSEGQAEQAEPTSHENRGTRRTHHYSSPGQSIQAVMAKGRWSGHLATPHGRRPAFKAVIHSCPDLVAYPGHGLRRALGRELATRPQILQKYRER